MLSLDLQSQSEVLEIGHLATVEAVEIDKLRFACWFTSADLMELPVNIAPLQPNGKPVKVELNSGDKVCPHASRIRPGPRRTELPATFVALDSRCAEPCLPVLRCLAAVLGDSRHELLARRRTTEPEGPHAQQGIRR